MSAVFGRLDRYIVLAIFGLSAVVGLGLVALYSFINFITEVDSGSRSLGVTQIFTMTLLLMPSGLYVLMPLVAMLGTLLGVGQLAAQSELTAMRAAGYSNLRIGRAALIAGLLLGVLAVVLGESLAPAGQQAAERVKSVARGGIAAGVSSKPVWLRDGNNIFLIRRLLAEDHFADAEIFRFDDALTLRSVLSVEDADYSQGVWLLNRVTETAFGGDHTRVDKHETLEWTSGLKPEVLRFYVLESESVSASGLMRLIEYLEANGLDASDQRLELWRKLIAPITVTAMVLFAVPFVFGPTRGGGAGQRLLLGVLVGVGFHLLNEVSANLGALYGWSAPVSAGTPTAVLMVLALIRLATAR
ncbi:lipopolysaccharide export system permease protein [Panacagrimonas perspica]|uniref:Lipopolysaccharide export system permease protein n=1 Tax=Panacagrimonas perspica TaxID=381431 RepID=A0A4S3K8K8_9GAMM|nr:LPS export ABC transporter permease LptG [Panacagrimonas perspica]TDU24150.1 lipopolysaccharide export system permease protein [Panacagrimonas perspica]THD04566.1 LPS export ABC transporter permease LptG [Panacagrimonas perspica]